MNTSLPPVTSGNTAATYPDNRSLYPLVTRRRVQSLLASYREQLTAATNELKLVHASNELLTAALEAQQAIIERLTQQRDDAERHLTNVLYTLDITERECDLYVEYILNLVAFAEQWQSPDDAQPSPDAPQTAATSASDAPTVQSSKKARTPRRRAGEAVQETMAEGEVKG